MHELVDEFYKCAAGEASWGALMPKIHSALGCSAVAYVIADFENDRSYQNKNLGLDEALLAEYEKYWDPINPWRKKGFEFGSSLPTRSLNAAFHVAEHLDMHDFWRTDVYNASLRKMDLSDLILFPLEVSRPTMIGVSAYAGNDKGVFTPEDRALANHFAPHLWRCGLLAENLSWARRFFANKEVANILKPAVLISDKMDLIEFNELAEDAVFRTGVMTRCAGKTAMTNARMRKELRAFIKKDSRPDMIGAADYVLCVLELTPNLSAVVFRVSSIWNFVAQRAVVSEYLIVFNATPPTPLSAVQDVAARYELTPAEQEVLVLLCQGLSPADISKRRQTALSTTRWHVKRIYAKLGISSQLELFKILFGAMAEANGADDHSARSWL